MRGAFARALARACCTRFRRDALRDRLRRSRQPGIARARLRADRRRGRRSLCLGDMVGYGPNPNECVEDHSRARKHAVLGNHDLAAIENFGVEYFNDAAREAIAWTQTVLDDENREWLNALPYELRFPDFLLVHGAPVNYFEYILDKRAAARAFESTDAPLVFIGHTHIAEYWVLEPDGTIGHKHLQHGGELILEAGQRYIVDVGSVGQPRDLNPDASFVFYEPEKNARRMDALSRIRFRTCAQDSRSAPAGLSRRSFESRAIDRVEVPFDDGNCFACGPENPDGHASALRSRRRGRAVPRDARAEIPGLARRRARRHRDGPHRRGDGACGRFCRASRRHRERQRAISQAGPGRRTDPTYAGTSPGTAATCSASKRRF